jgi:hypothetical protein
MSDFEIDFEWPRAEKYELRPELRPATADEVSRSRLYSSDPRGSMHAPERALSPNIPDADLPLYFGHIVPIGRATYRRPKPEALELAVKALVECKQTPFHKVALAVVRAVGTLDDSYGENLPEEDEGYRKYLQPLEQYGMPDPRSDQVCDWYGVAHQLRLMFGGKWFDDGGEEYTWPDPKTQQVGQLGVLLVPDKNNKPVLAVRPDSLADALVFTAARMKATGTTFDICEHCRSPFLSGGIRYRAKRGDAKFCSDPCRYSYHNEQRRRAKGE